MLKNELEALLFSSGRKMDVEELSKLSRAKPDEVQSALAELKKEYDQKPSVMLVNEGTSWKLTVREQFLSLVRKIVTETELTKTVIETLAVIAFKYPIKQSDLIKIRTNKSYDHLKELEEMGYISRQKHGRTNLIKLTQKFFEYFDLKEEKLKDQFKDFTSISKAIEEKETEIEKIKQEQKEKAEEEKKKDEQIKKEVDLVGAEDPNTPLKTYESEEAKKEEKAKPEIIEEKLGSLEVVDEPSEEELQKERERIQEIKEENIQHVEETKEEQSEAATKEQSEVKKEEQLEEGNEEEKPKFKGEGIKVSKDMDKIIDEKVDKILHPQKEQEEDKKEISGENKGKEEKEESKSEEPKDLLEASMEEKESKEEKQE